MTLTPAAPLPVHPTALAQAQVHLNLPVQRCSGYSLPSGGSRSCKPHSLSSRYATSLPVVPDFYTPSRGCSFRSRSPRGTTHRGQESSQGTTRDGDLLKSARGQLLAEPQTSQQKTTRRGKGVELQVQHGQGVANAFAVTRGEVGRVRSPR